MDDLISRQDAIKAVTYGALSSATLFGRSDAGMTALRETVRAIEQLPSAQPIQNNTSNALETLDCIDRQAAIDWLTNEWDGMVTSVFDGIKNLPSAQPEIIRCRECKHMQEDKIFHQYWCNGREVKPDHFCGYAERRTDA